MRMTMDGAPPLQLIATCARARRTPLMWGAMYMFLYVVCQMSQPLLLRHLVMSVSEDTFNGLYYALGLCGVTVLGAFANQKHLHHAFRCVITLHCGGIALVGGDRYHLFLPTGLEFGCGRW